MAELPQDRAEEPAEFVMNAIGGPRFVESSPLRRAEKMRPLGIPMWQGKLLQRVMRSFLDGMRRAAIRHPLPRPSTRSRV